MILRCSMVAAEAGASDAERDVLDFALKFYAPEGNWDPAGNNMSAFSVRDP